MADRVVLLKDGRVEAEGSYKHLKEKSAYMSEIIEKQINYAAEIKNQDEDDDLDIQ